MKTNFMENWKNKTPGKYYKAAKTASAKLKVESALKGDEYYGVVKYDGEWCRVIKENDDNILFQSRSLSKVTGEYGDKTLHLPHLVEEMKNFPNGTVLLGELCFLDPNKTSKDVGSILRCLPPKAVTRQVDNPLHFKVFDILSLDYQDFSTKPAIERIAEVQKIKGNYFTPVEYSENKVDLLEKTMANNGEGLVLMRKMDAYNFGNAKAWHSIKIKKELGEIEAPIVQFLDPVKEYTGKDVDNWKYFIDNQPVTKPFFKGWKNGIEVKYKNNLIKIASGLSDADREWLSTPEAVQLLENNQLVAVFSGMAETEDSVRHPILIRIRTEA